MSTKPSKGSREFVTTDAKGRRTDRHLHDPLLNQFSAQTAVAAAAIDRAMKDGHTYEEALQMYGVRPGQEG